MSHTLRYSAALSVVLGALVSVTAGCGGSDATGGAVSTGATGGATASGGGGGTTSSGGTMSDAGEDGSGGTSTGSGGSGGGGKGGSGTGGSTGGSGGSKSGSGGSGAAATDELLDEIEGHCERDCDAQYALDCAPPTSNSLVCETSCVAATAQLGDFCLREYADYVACRADGGYACLTETQPYPNSTCVVQQQAYSTCAQHIGCKRECAARIAEGCTTMAFDTCLEECIAEAANLPSDCNYYGETLSYCRATQANLTCNGERLLTPQGCSYYVIEIGSCIADESTDYCDGWCYAANELGCGGDDCLADCQAKTMDATCGAAWTDMLDCAMFFGDAACSGDTFMANGICDSEVSTYSTCVAGAAGAGG